MLEIPQSLEETIAQAKTATAAALGAGELRFMVELVIPEIALQAQSLAWQFAPLFESYGGDFKIIFPDTGAAALAKRDWGEIVFGVTDLGSSRTPVNVKIKESDRAFLVIAPSAVEVEQVEKLCNIANENDRPVVLLIPQLENIATIGIGYAARQLRERFLNTLVTAYYLRPFEGGLVRRVYPDNWEVWREQETGDYQLITQVPNQPMGEELELLLMGTEPKAGETSPTPIKRGGFMADLQKFIRALTQ